MFSSIPTRNRYLNWPNYLSFLRVALIPVVMVMIGLQESTDSAHYRPALGYGTAALFVLSGLSDLVDGYLARRMGLTSIFGKFLDPMADKLMVLAVMVMLIPLGVIPAWLVVIFLSRELSITTLRAIAAGEGSVITADVWGKKKTALQYVALTCFLLPPRFILINTRTVGWFFLILALIVSLGSGVNYLLTFFKEVLEKKSSAS
jgi:CDP-diacylglycerol---glycerol-3-phosphate 3-phosphatidyltransferase